MDFLNFNPLYLGKNIYPRPKNKRVKLSPLSNKIKIMQKVLSQIFSYYYPRRYIYLL